MSPVMLYVCFCLSLLVLISGFIFVRFFAKEKNLKYKAIILSLCVFLANVILLTAIIYYGSISTEKFCNNGKELTFWPYFGEYEIKSNSNELGYSILYGLIFATKMAGLGLKYQSIIPAAFNLDPDKVISTMYGIYLIFMTVLTPIVFGGLIASFFEGLVNVARYVLLRRKSTVYYFSELNDKSFALAIDILKNGKKKHPMIVFCNTDKNSCPSLFKKARNKGFVTFIRSEIDFSKAPSLENCFVEISNNEIKNLSNTKELFKRLQAKPVFAAKSEIHLFSENEEDINALNACVERNVEVRVKVHSRSKKIFYQYLLEKPLYRCLDKDQKEFNILVVGGGLYGREIVKACLWCTKMGSEYKTVIHIVDKDVHKAHGYLRKEAPEIFNGEYDLKFYEADVNTAEFSRILNDYCNDVNFIAVVLGDDSLNAQTSVYLRNFFDRQITAKRKKPVIAANIETVQYQNISSKYLSDNKIDIFGCDKDFYSSKMLMESILDKLAINCNAVYIGQNEKPSDERKKYYSLGTSEYNRRSSMANGIHIFYKLYALGYEVQLVKDGSSDYENVLDKFCKNLEKHLDELAYIEHERWNAYSRTNGWTGIPLEKNYIKSFLEITNGKNKNYKTKQHVCLCSWDELTKADKLIPGQVPYQELDYSFIKAIPKILGLVEDETNVSKLKYYIKKI